MSFESWWRDLLYGVRVLRRSPGFALVAISALSIGVGANITIFSFVNGWLFRPLDAREPSRLVRITGPGADSIAAGATDNEAHIRAQDYLQYRDRNQSFSAIAASHAGGPTRVRTTGPPQMIPVTPVTGNYFETVGVTAALGRALTPEDGAPGARPVIVLSDQGWHRFFDGAPDVLGATATLDGVAHTVVGVLPPWFTGTYAPMVPQIYRPIIERSGVLAIPVRLQLLGRLRPGVTAAQAGADLTRIATQLTDRDREVRFIEIYPARNVVPFLLRAVSVVAIVFGLIVVVVLLVACDNIAILAAIRSAARSREVGIRLALGASRLQLIRQLAAESTIVCATGGAVGMFIAYATARFATQFYMPVPMPFALTFKPDWRVALFAIGISCLAMALCGLAPALKSLKSDLLSALRGEAFGTGVQSGLVITQMALSTVLLMTALILARSLLATVAPDQRFVSRNVAMTTVAMAGSDYTPARRAALLATLLERVEAAPGVASATIVENIPLTNNAPITPVDFRSGEQTALVWVNHVSRGLFRTLSIPLLLGRDFNAADDVAAASVGIVNETLASRFWPGQNPIGQQLVDGKGSLIEVVGLARDSKYESIDEQPKAFLYRPVASFPGVTPTFLLKPDGDPASVLPLVSTRLAELDPELVTYNVMPLDERLTLGNVLNRAAAIVSGSLGLLALALGSIGIYGTMSFLVQQRRREIGIRVALGASRSSVMALITKRGMSWVAGGLAIGLLLGEVAALGLSRIVRNVGLVDVVALVLTTVGLAGTAYLACLVPARRASRVDPLQALRDE